MAPDAVSVVIIGDCLLRITFETGEVKDYDARPLLEMHGYESLRDPAMFRTAHVLYGAVTWADETDINPEWVYEDGIPVTALAQNA